MQDLNVAIIQTNLIWEDKAANFSHLEKKHFSQIKPGQVDLLILPEMFNTGFSMNTTVLAEAMQGESVDWLIKWANRLDCQIGTSLIIKEEDKFYNRFLVVCGDGILNFYDKRHLFRMAGENNFFEPGTNKVIHHIKGWNVLLQVCYDLRFPVFSRNKFQHNQKQYDAVVYVANWPAKRSTVWDILLQARAIENQAYCIGVNRVGLDGNEISYSGDSACIDPWGKTLIRTTKNTEAVKFLTLKRNVLLEIESSFPAHLDAD